MRKRLQAAGLAVALGCITSMQAADVAPQRLLSQLEFLRDGKTLRAEVEARLGAPETTYADNRIAAYSAEVLAADHRLFVCPCPAGIDIEAKFKLMLRFSTAGILEQHELVNRD